MIFHGLLIASNSFNRDLLLPSSEEPSCQGSVWQEERQNYPHTRRQAAHEDEDHLPPRQSQITREIGFCKPVRDKGSEGETECVA